MLKDIIKPAQVSAPSSSGAAINDEESLMKLLAQVFMKLGALESRLDKMEAASSQTIQSPVDPRFTANLTRTFQEATVKAAEAHRARLAGEAQPLSAHW